MTRASMRPLWGSADPRTLRAAPAFFVRALALSPVLLAGCTAILDTDKKQCEEVSDCAELFGPGTPYSCEANYCVRPFCVGDSDCTGGGFPTAVCAGDGRCQAGCIADAECGESNVCDETTHRCKARECTVSEDCVPRTPTVQCIDSICVDETWGCVGDPDERPRATMPTATVTFLFGQAGTRTPILGSTAKVCTNSLFVETCDTTLPGTKAVQDDNGVFTITGLSQNGNGLRIAVDPPAGSGYLGVDIYSQRPYRDVTALPPVTTLTRASLDTLTSAFKDPEVANRQGSGGLVGFVYDCNNNPAAGVKFEIPKGIVDMSMPPYYTVLTYFTGLAPNPAAQETSANGLVTGINFPTTTQVQVTTTLGGQVMSQGGWKFLGDRITNIFFYPRNYGG